MIYEGKVLALIPARGGSKRLPRKNILAIGGKPMIAWTIEAALNSRYIDDIVVSTDDNEIANVSKEYGASVPFDRPMELSTDDAASIDVVIHAIDALEKKGDLYQYILLLQPTSPLRTAQHIDEAIGFLIEKSADSIIGVSEVPHPVEWVSTLLDDYSMHNFIKCGLSRKNTTSQDYQVRHVINGSIYLSKINRVKQEATMLLSTNCYGYLMDSQVSVDVDNIGDLLFAEFLMQKSKKNKQNEDKNVFTKSS